MENSHRKTTKKLRQSTFALYHLSKCSPYKVLKQAYFSLAESYLRHGITAWGTATHCKTLQLTQNRLLKLLYKNQQHTKNYIQNHPNIKIYTTNNSETINTTNQNNNTIITRYQTSHNNTDLYKDLQILNIEGIYKTSIVNEFYNDTNLLECIDHQQNTRRRAQKRYKVPSFRNEYGKQSLAVTLPTTLNNMPTNLLKIQNKISRKKLIKKHFLN